MHLDVLKSLIKKPEVQRLILKNYAGAFSMGITKDKSNFAIRVNIEGSTTKNIPKFIDLKGERIPVVANPGFSAPMPL
jgi:hypothetical protein